MLQANGIQCFETIARAETVQFNLLTITMQIAHITNALGFLTQGHVMRSMFHN